MELGPSSAEAHGNCGLFLLVGGRNDEALMEGRLAQQLDWFTFHRLTAPATDPRIDAFLTSPAM